MTAVQRMAWEKPYLEALLEKLAPSGEVLQIGEGMVTEMLSGNAPTVVKGDWQTQIPKLGKFDAIFCYELFSIPQSTDAEKALESGNQLLKEAHALFPDLMTVRYSDYDLETFFENLTNADPVTFPRFLIELKSHGQITEEQYERYAKKTIKASEAKKDLFLTMIDLCLEHLKEGGRLSWFASAPLSLFENSAFFEKVITNPHYEYEEEMIDIDVPPSCPYYKFDQGLVMVIKKL